MHRRFLFLLLPDSPLPSTTRHRIFTRSSSKSKLHIGAYIEACAHQNQGCKIPQPRPGSGRFLRSVNITASNIPAAVPLNPFTGALIPFTGTVVPAAVATSASQDNVQPGKEYWMDPVWLEKYINMLEESVYQYVLGDDIPDFMLGDEEIWKYIVSDPKHAPSFVLWAISNSYELF